MEAVNESGAKRGPAKGGGLHIALVPPSVKTADANLSPPVPAPAAKAQSSNSPSSSSSSSKPSCTANPTPEVKRGSSSKKKDDKPWTEERLAKAKRKRIHARQEIIDSEESYLTNLTALMDTYVKPMKQVVDLADHKKMFADVKSICDFHEIFYPFVKKSSDIGYCFLKYADYLKIYTEFINHYAGVIECLSENRKNKKFTHFLKEARTNAKMEITSYLIQPVQRIPRYVLLLKELQRYTWPEHHEHDNLVKALAKAEEIATHVNERKRQIENMTKTLEVQSNITGTFDSLIKPDRKMIREDVLIKVSSGMFSSMKRKERVMFLFSDLLLWTTTAYQFRGKMSLAAAHAEVSKKIDLGLEISSSKELCLLVFESKAQMESWIADFKAGKEYAKKVRKRLMEVRKRTIDSKRGKAHTLVMEAFKTLEKDRSSAGSNENLENLSTHASETGGEISHSVPHSKSPTPSAPAKKEKIDLTNPE
eukprot:jgi/Bigna1/127950/aug1.5_g2658